MYGRYLRGKGPSPTARSGVIPVYQEKLFLFPTKYDWRDKSSLELIQTNARQLVDHMDIIAGQDDSCTPHVFLPALGCGMGGLQWEYVEPVISGLLDDRFTVILND